MLPTNRLPIQILRDHTQPVVSLKMRIDALHPIPQHVAAGNLKTRLMEQVIQIEKATRFAMVERLGLGKNLLEPMLLLGRGGRAAFNENASLEFLAQEASVLGALHADFRDIGAAFGTRFHQLLLTQAHKGLANGRAPDSRLLFQTNRRKTRAGPELGIDDLGAQCVVRLVLQALIMLVLFHKALG